MSAEVPEVVSEWLGMTVPQCEELRYRLNLLRSTNSGYGTVLIEVRKYRVKQVNHLERGKPADYGEEEK